MENTISQELYDKGLISETTFRNLEKGQASPTISVYWELKTLLYLGVLLLSTGLGILIYKNIDSISHQVVLVAIAALSASCFIWCTKRKKPFSYEKVESPNSYFDYILLLATLSFLTFVGYLQFQFEVFGTRYGIATFLPMLVLFFISYYFDHIGILTLAIANLALWAGIASTPKEMLLSGNLDDKKIVYTYIIFGYLLLAAAYYTDRLNRKKHFFFSYYHYGVHAACIALLACYFIYDYGPALIVLAVFAATAWLIYRNAYKTKSFYFLLWAVLYSYIAVSAFAIRSLFIVDDVAGAYVGFLYFIGSAVGVVLLLMNLNKKMKAA